MGLTHLLLFATSAMSQTTDSSDDTSSSGTTNRLCNSSISAANASGLITYDVTDPNRQNNAPGHSWAITVSGGNGQQIQRKFWYDTEGQNYADDVGLDMDVCAFPNFYLPLNAHRLGQHDPGNCSTVFSQSCIDAVTSMASASALKWVTYSSPPPYENLTAGVLPSICVYIADDLRETIKKKCGAQMQSDDGITANFENPMALTGYNSSTLYSSNCTLSSGNKSFYEADFSYPVSSSDWDIGSDANYDEIANAITPILTVYMPVANTKRKACCNTPNSVLECIRASNFAEGSRVAPALAAGTAWSKPGMSAGAKGGLAAGVVVGVLVAVGLGLYLWIVRRRKRARAESEANNASMGDGAARSDAKLLLPEADSGSGVYELSPKDGKQELDAVVVSEMGGGGGKLSELPSTDGAVELPAGNVGRER